MDDEAVRIVKMSVSLVQYNVRATAMLNIVKCDLTRKERLDLLVRQIESMAAKLPIFMLNECGHTEMAVLHPLFAKLGYYAICSHYSTMPRRDGFGDVIAFPTMLYELLSYERTTPALEIIPPTDITEDQISKPEGKPSPNNLYKECQIRDNTLLRVVLRQMSTRKEFNVYNWHMPCMWYWKAGLTLFSEALLKSIDRFTPYILGTSLNVRPSYSQYRQLTGQPPAFDANDLPYPTWTFDKTLPALIDTKKSYSEDDFTNRCLNTTKDELVPFSAVLDYIFTSADFKNVIEPRDKFPLEYYPSKRNASDHLPLQRAVVFKSEEDSEYVVGA